MILNISGRTDIVAFYTPWLLNRLKEGFVDVRNPFFAKKISRIYFKDVDGIIFCTKNPIPILSSLDQIKIPFVFQITLTPYKKDIEPNVPPKGQIIKAIKQLSSKIGKDKVYVRYDPVFLSPKYSLEYHKKAFANLCKLLDGSVEHIIISFLDDYKNVRKNQKVINNQPFTQEDYKEFGTFFAQTAKNHHMTVQTCAEEKNLKEYGFFVSDCVTPTLAYKLTGKTNWTRWKARKNDFCHCVSMGDIGSYNSCLHFCKYCYANYQEEEILKNHQTHDPNSSLLIGKITEEDEIKVRK